MSLLDNQSFRRKVTFVKSNDSDQVVSFSINVQCNHDIDKSILQAVEDTISNMLIDDYHNKEDIDDQERQLKEDEKVKLQLKKEAEKIQLQLQKQQQKQVFELEKLRIKQQMADQKQQMKQPKEKPIEHAKCVSKLSDLARKTTK